MGYAKQTSSSDKLDFYCLVHSLLKTLFRAQKWFALWSWILLGFPCRINVSLWVFLLRSNELWHEAQEIQKWTLRWCHFFCVLSEPLPGYVFPRLWCCQRPLDITLLPGLLVYYYCSFILLFLTIYKSGSFRSLPLPLSLPFLSS